MALLKNPALTKGQPPEQLKRMDALTGMMEQLQKNMAGGKTTPKERAAMMAQFQSTMMQLMAQMQSLPPAERKGAHETGRAGQSPGKTPE
jgi:hypothetical protein